jgi:hypothetical protein
MNRFIRTLRFTGISVLVLLICGCIVSATFIIDELFFFTPKNGFYFYQVDLTDDEDWEDNRDKIDMIDAVGFEFYYTNTLPGSVSFDAYVDEYSGFGADPGSVPSGAAQIIDSFTVVTGTGKMSYSQSLNAVMELDILKKLAKTGQFDFYVTSTGQIGTAFILDSARVIVTLSTK